MPQLLDPVTILRGVGPLQKTRLEKLGVETVQDLLTLLPRRWDDYSIAAPIKSLRLGEAAIARGAVSEIKLEHSYRGLPVVRAVLTDESGSIGLVWFNQAFLVPTLERLKEMTVMGKVARDRHKGKVLHVQQYELQPRIVPIYPETAGVTSKQLRYFLSQVLPIIHQLTDPLPEKIREKEGLIAHEQAWRILHAPANQTELTTAKHRIGFDELLRITLNVISQKHILQTKNSIPIKHDLSLVRDFVHGLPFTLTADQKKAAWQVMQDLEKPHPMNRLLNGDVGSGKTIVGAIAILQVQRAKLQTVWLAPTEILAEQHARNLYALLKDYSISVGLVTGSTARKDGELGAREKALACDVVVGTHALLQENIQFPNLGFVIVDEQHRFGVEQRSHLKSSRKDELVPHLLSMTATPIPRTAALALYGDLELSTIRQMPSGRKPVLTEIVPEAKREEAYRKIRAEIKKGRQAYIICPLVEETNQKETLFDYDSVKAAKAEYKRLKTEVFPDLHVGLLHGKMSSKEKAFNMEQFRAGIATVLVATSVVEVGVDIENVTVMLIEGADRFGLAQLHQLRGRVGRGLHQSHCLLIHHKPTERSAQRLDVFCKTTDGFELAEKDLTMRGPGEMYGTAQSGLPDLKMASLTDMPLIAKARRVAEEIITDGIEKYPDLAALVETTHRAHLE